MRPRLLTMTFLTGLLLGGQTATATVLNTTPLGRYATGQFDESAAEIPAFDPNTNRLFVVNASVGIDVLDLSIPSDPTLLFTIDAPGANSVAVRDNLVAIAIENADKQANGTVAFYDAGLSGSDPPLTSVTVGALPDMLTFTPDGTKVVVANEGEPNEAYTVDPEGSISIIDVSGLASNTGPATVLTASFQPFNSQKSALQAAGVRIYGPESTIDEPDDTATVAQDLEPEYVAVSGDRAFVSLQENNAIAIVDLPSISVTSIVPLGLKDHSLADSGFSGHDGTNSSNAFDASDRDVDGTGAGGGQVNIQNWPTLGMYQPDTITVFESGGETYLLTANEGDARDYDGFSEESRGAGLSLDPTAFPDAATLQRPENLGRLTVTEATGDTDGDGLLEEIHSFGTRSFSVWRANADDSLTLVFDSGDDFERITAGLIPTQFNSDNDENQSFDSRSDAKGPEPEAIAIGEIGDTTYAFIGLERVGGVMVYDISDPTAPVFLQYLNTRDFGVTDVETDLDRVGDLGPEGLLFINEADSPTGVPLLVVANEVSGTTTIFSVPEPASATLLVGLTAAMGLTGRRRTIGRTGVRPLTR